MIVLIHTTIFNLDFKPINAVLDIFSQHLTVHSGQTTPRQEAHLYKSTVVIDVIHLKS